MDKHDVVIVGAGPAGLAAAIYCLRRDLKTINISKAIGGQAAIASEVQNWLGEESIGGFELMQKALKQAEKLGAKFISDEVSAIAKTDEGFLVKTGNAEFAASAVILAFGLTPRDLNVPGEEKFKGKGVSYCATCDGPLYRGKSVAVIGGGNAALEAAEYLSKLAAKVIMINNGAKFIGEEGLFEQVAAIGNVEMHYNLATTAVIGETKVEKIAAKNSETGAAEEFVVDGVFVEIGHAPKTDWLKDFVSLNEKKEVITDKAGLTSVPGVFAAGDCTDVGFNQMTIAAGEGAKAALSAYKYIAAKNGKVATPDWGKKK